MKIISETTEKRPYSDTKITLIIEANYKEIYDNYIDGKENRWFYEPYYEVEEIEKDKKYKVIKFIPFLD